MTLKKILMIAYHFPPLSGSSGIQRTLRFAKFLPGNGWQPIVLTTSINAYEQTSQDQLSEVPANVVVRRAWAWDSARHLSLRGRYLARMARPDRWISWVPSGIIAGLDLIRRYKPDVLWSTYPIASAHLIGHALSKITDIPWVADFRDPMAQDGDPSDIRLWDSFRKVEEKVFSRAAVCVFTTPGTLEFYKSQPISDGVVLKCVENGYDDDVFQGIKRGNGGLVDGKFTLLHSGIVYPYERDPTSLFEALAILRDAGELVHNKFVIRFRAPVHEQLIWQLTLKYQLEDLVEIMPPVPYREALAEMMRADALLIMQAENCNNQVPAKLYEYMRCQRPIIGLTHPKGDTAKIMQDSGIEALAPLDDPCKIADLIMNLITNPNLRSMPSLEAVVTASRENRTRKFAEILNCLV